MEQLPSSLRFVLALLEAWVERRQQLAIEYLQAENRVLLEQLGGRPRLTDAQRRLLARKGEPLGRKQLHDVAAVARADTIRRWHRQLVVARQDERSRARTGGRPPVPEDVRQLVVRMATESHRWGYTRIRDALRGLGHEIGRSTVRRILKEEGTEPAPVRRQSTPWREFFAAHAAALAVPGFFTLEGVGARGWCAPSCVSSRCCAHRPTRPPATRRPGITRGSARQTTGGERDARRLPHRSRLPAGRSPGHAPSRTSLPGSPQRPPAAKPTKRPWRFDL